MTRPATPKLSWIEKAKETHKFHSQKLRQDPDWCLSDTAKALKRSLGGISEDLMIVSFLKTHEDELKEFEYLKDALVFIREIKRKMQLQGVD